MSLFSGLFSESGNSRGVERERILGRGIPRSLSIMTSILMSKPLLSRLGRTLYELLWGGGGRHKGGSCTIENVISLNHGCRTGRPSGQNLKWCNTRKPTVEDLQKFRHRIVM